MTALSFVGRFVRPRSGDTSIENYDMHHTRKSKVSSSKKTKKKKKKSPELRMRPTPADASPRPRPENIERGRGDTRRVHSAVTKSHEMARSPKAGTPVVIPPWSYSLREVKDKVRKRDGLRRRVGGSEEVLVMGDVEGLWRASSSYGDGAESEMTTRFLPTVREEERLERMFEKELSSGEAGGQQNNPFGRGSYRARKSMGEKRWEACKEREMQQTVDHVEILEQRFGKRFVRECRRRVYRGSDRAGDGGDGGDSGDGGDGGDGGEEAGVRKVVCQPETQGMGPNHPRRRLNVGVPVGQAMRKRPSTAEGSMKQVKATVHDGVNEDGWRIVAARPMSN